MKSGRGLVVTSELQKSKDSIALHDVKGRSPSHLKDAAKVEIGDIIKTDSLWTVTVGVTNSSAGHKIPTGVPTRALLLRINVMDAKHEVVFNTEKVFAKILHDKQGNRLWEASDIFLNAYSIYEDTRIPPMQTRFSTISFQADKDGEITIEAKLYYRLLEEIGGYEEMLIEIDTDKKQSDYTY
jgi:hypothetical protein